MEGREIMESGGVLSFWLVSAQCLVHKGWKTPQLKEKCQLSFLHQDRSRSGMRHAVAETVMAGENEKSPWRADTVGSSCSFLKIQWRAWYPVNHQFFIIHRALHVRVHNVSMLDVILALEIFSQSKACLVVSQKVHSSDGVLEHQFIWESTDAELPPLLRGSWQHIWPWRWALRLFSVSCYIKW